MAYYQQRTIGPDPAYYAQTSRGMVEPPQPVQTVNPGQPSNPIQNVLQALLTTVPGSNWGDYGNTSTYNSDFSWGSPSASLGGSSFGNRAQNTNPSGGTSLDTGQPAGNYGPGASITNPYGDNKVIDLNQSAMSRFANDFSMSNMSWKDWLGTFLSSGVSPLAGLVTGVMSAYEKGSGLGYDQPEGDIQDQDPSDGAWNSFSEKPNYGYTKMWDDYGDAYWQNPDDPNDWWYPGSTGSSGGSGGSGGGGSYPGDDSYDWGSYYDSYDDWGDDSSYGGWW